MEERAGGAAAGESSACTRHIIAASCSGRLIPVPLVIHLPFLLLSKRS